MSADRDRRSIDLTTLVITAAASAGAAYVCSHVWAPGTLASAAFTPVLVAIIKEALQRPTEVVSRAVPVRGVVRSARTGGDASAPPPDDPHEEPTRVAQPGTIRGTPSSSRNSSGWRLAVVTGLLGFVVCALVLTVPELVAGESASGGGRHTTLFGGESKRKKRARERTTPTTTAPTRTVTRPQRTVTVPAPTTTTTVPTTTTPPPTSTAPAPAPTTTAPTTTEPIPP